MASSTTGLVPITRAFLAKFYEKYPLDPLPDGFDSLEERVIALTDSLDAQRMKVAGQPEGLAEELLMGEPPHKLDENFWRNREQIEEAMLLLEERNWPAALKAEEQGLTPALEEVALAAKKWHSDFQHLVDVVSGYQKKTSDKIASMVWGYLPQDFRGTFLKQQQERSQRRREAEVETLLASGGTIKQKYALLWQQQMDRRKTLASLGAATGVYRTIVTYLVGVPQVLLDFVRTINDHNGPMEEQRLKYGPQLYRLTTFVNRIRVLLALWWAGFDSASSAPSNSEVVGVVNEALRVYSEGISNFLHTLEAIFENSPFLISAEEAMSLEDKNKAAEDFKEAKVSYGQTLAVPLTVEQEGTVVAWEFNLMYGKDVGFKVDFIAPDGSVTGVFPAVKVDSHQGSFNAPGIGTYHLIWDNTYSYMTNKVVRYKAGAIPPVDDSEQVAAEEALTHPEGTSPSPAAEVAAA